MTDNGLVFRAALREFATNDKVAISRRDRRLIGNFLDRNPELAEMVAEHFAPEVFADDPPPSPTPILDKFGQWFKWIIDNQDKVLAFIQGIMSLVISIITSLTV